MWLYPIVKKFVKKDGKLYPITDEIIKKDDTSYNVKQEFAKVESYPPEDYYEWEETTITGFSEKGQAVAEEILGIVFPEKCMEIKAQAFLSGKGFSCFNTVVITENIKNIGTAVFNGVTSLKKIYITEAGEELSLGTAVLGGSNIESFNISKRVVELGGSSFSGCNSLKTVTSSEREKGIKLIYPFMSCGNLETVDIKNIEYIDNAFNGCHNLKKIRLSFAKEVEIGAWLFRNCNNVEEIVVDGNVPANISFNGINTTNEGFEVVVNGDWLEILQGCFMGGSIKKITINGKCDVIGDWCFANCSNLTEMNIPETVVEIGASVFAGCSNLTKINIPETVTKIGKAAFDCCTSLTEIYIPETVTEMGNGVFSGCGNATVYIPKKYETEEYLYYLSLVSVKEVIYY